MEQAQAADERDAWPKYAAIISNEKPSASDAGELREIMRLLNLTAVDVRQHSAVIAEARNLAHQARDIDGLRKAAADAMAAWVALRDETAKKVKAMEDAVTAADGQARAAYWAITHAEDAAARLRSLTAAHAFLFPAAVEPLAAWLSSDRRPKRVDGRLLALDVGRFYSPAELATVGLDAEDLARAQLPNTGGRIFGGVIVAWAKQWIAKSRAERRAELEEVARNAVDERALTAPPDATFSRHNTETELGVFPARLAHLPEIGGKFKGESIRIWAANEQDRIERARVELAAMDEQDKQDTGPKEVKQDAPAQAEPATTGKKRTKG